MSQLDTPDSLPETEADAEAIGLVCEKCEQPPIGDQMTVCPHCGWYPALGTFVEVSQEWEEAAASGGKAAGSEPTMLEVWSKLIPAWGWALLGTAALTLSASIAVRFTLADEAALTSWSVAQLFIGLALQIACHVAVFTMVSIDDPEASMMDIVVRPLRAWKRLFQGMPKRQWLVHGLVCGIMLVFGAVLIIGHIPYERVWDWNIKEPPKKNLLGAIADAAPESNDDMSMEDALNSFADDAAVNGAGAKKKNKNKATNLVRKKIDALILGYQVSREGQISTFFLATEYNGQLMYAGRVTPNLGPDEGLKLVERMRVAHSQRPLISAPDEETYWLQPRFTCRVTYDKRVESGRLQGLLWEEMLGEVKLPW